MAKREQIKRIKALVFDFDGTIIDSAHIKGLSFQKLFKQFNRDFQELVYKYHIDNLSLTREEKFKHYYSQLGLPINDDVLNTLSKQFSEIVYTKMEEAERIAGFDYFLKQNKKKYSLYIVSNAPTTDINDYLKSARLSDAFLGVYGTPLSKMENFTRNILNTVIPNEILYFGDTFEDYKISKKLGIHFIGIDTNNIFKDTNIPYRHDFTAVNLYTILTEL